MMDRVSDVDVCVLDWLCSIAFVVLDCLCVLEWVCVSIAFVFFSLVVFERHTEVSCSSECDFVLLMADIDQTMSNSDSSDGSSVHWVPTMQDLNQVVIELKADVAWLRMQLETLRIAQL